MLNNSSFRATEIYSTEARCKVGSIEQDAAVYWETQDGSAKAGNKYVHIEGIVTFMDGQDFKSITIACRNDEVFSPTVEFKVMQ